MFCRLLVDEHVGSRSILVQVHSSILVLAFGVLADLPVTVLFREKSAPGGRWVDV